MSEGRYCFAIHTVYLPCQIDPWQGAAEPENRILPGRGAFRGGVGKMPHQRVSWPGSATGYH